MGDLWTSSMASKNQLKRTIEKRDRDSNGCVKCSSGIGNLPTCGKNKQAVQISQTCNTCAHYECRDVSSTKNRLGEIVGGTVGGVSFVIIVSLVVLFVLLKKRRGLRLREDDEGESSSESDEIEMKSRNNSVRGDKRHSGEPGLPGTDRKYTRNMNNRSLSFYETFTRPGFTSRNSARNSKIQPLTQPKRKGIRRNMSMNSLATNTSSSNASNILPIAYIPGVRVKPTKNNTRSIFSSDTKSMNSEAYASELEMADDTRYLSPHQITTAVRGQPKLVNMHSVQEEDEEDTTDEFDQEHYKQGLSPGLVGQDSIHLNSNGSLTSQFDKSSRSSVLASQANETLRDDETDSDVDSDIGEINRATSVKHMRENNNSNRYVHDPIVLMDSGTDLPLMQDTPSIYRSPNSSDNIQDGLAEHGLPVRNAANSSAETDYNNPFLDNEGGSFVLNVEFNNRKEQQRE